MSQSIAHTIAPGCRTRAGHSFATARGLVVALACGWLLMLMTYSPPIRENQGTLATDAVAVGKLVVRIGVVTILMPLVFCVWRSPRRPAVLRILAPWAAFLAWAIVSVVWSPLVSVSLAQAFSLGVLVLLSLVVALTCDGPPALSRGIFSLALSLMICSSVLLLLRIFQPALGSLTREGNGVLHSTGASAAAGLGIVLLAAGALLGRWTWARVLLAPGLAVHSTALVLANNRLAMIATVLTSLGLFLAYGPRGWRSLIVAAGATVGIFYLTLDGGLSIAGDTVNNLGAYAARGQSAQELAALSGRAEMWEAIWKSFLDSPVVGHGYFVSSARGELYVWYSWGNWTAHNLWLQVLVSTGIIGAALVAWALLQTCGGLLCAAIRGTVDSRLAALFAAILAWFLIWGAANESFMGPLQPESVVFFTCIGLAAGVLAGAEPRKEPSPA